MTTSLGLRIHRSKKWQAGLAASTSWIVFFVLATVLLSSNKPLSDSSGLLTVEIIFLFFSIVLTHQFIRHFRTKYLLEFSDDGLFDRSSGRNIFVPYKKIEIFSPPAEELFEISEDSRDHIVMACQMIDQREDFIFVEKIERPSEEIQQKIISLLREKISRFEHLVNADGSGIGDDSFVDDETQS